MGFDLVMPMNVFGDGGDLGAADHLRAYPRTF
jgi:hypothetical protein